MKIKMPKPYNPGKGLRIVRPKATTKSPKMPKSYVRLGGGKKY
jgi:hypothetical protein